MLTHLILRILFGLRISFHFDEATSDPLACDLSAFLNLFPERVIFHAFISGAMCSFLLLLLCVFVFACFCALFLASKYLTGFSSNMNLYICFRVLSFLCNFVRIKQATYYERTNIAEAI